MATTEHTVIKPEVLSNTVVGLVDRELVIPQLFIKQGIDQFRGAKDDTINMVVPGVLPAHEYAWRNDRSTPIQLDTYTERKIALKFGGHAYSAVEITDEQMDFDLRDWGRLLDPQSRAVAKHLEAAAVKEMKDAKYAVSLKATADNLSNDIVEARRCLNLMQVPDASRTLLVGSDFEAALQTNPTFNTAMNVGDSDASTALKDANIGRWKGFNIISSTMIDPGEAYAFVPSAFAFLTAAPYKPDSVGMAANASYDGIAMRWMRDYDPMYLRDRSIVDTYYGFQAIKDPIRWFDSTAGQEKVSEGEYMIRCVKLTLETGKDSYFEAAAGSGAQAAGKALGLTKRAAATTAKPAAGVGG